MSSIKDSFNKSAHFYDDVAFLQQEVASRLREKLQLVKINNSTALDLGAGTGLFTKLLKSRFDSVLAIDIAKDTLKINKSNNKNIIPICASAYELPFTDNSFGVVLSNLMLQWCFNLPVALKEANRILKEDSPLMFSTFGVDTLCELRYSWRQVDNNYHTNDFFDMHTIGDMLIGAGFSSPVMETEHITLTYDKVFDIMADLKKLGANLVQNQHSGLTGKDKFNKMLEYYEGFRVNNKLPVTYEVIYGHAWKQNSSLASTVINNNLA